MNGSGRSGLTKMLSGRRMMSQMGTNLDYF